MKLKKLLAAVTAAALAVTTMAVTSFTVNAAAFTPYILLNVNSNEWGINGAWVAADKTEITASQTEYEFSYTAGKDDTWDGDQSKIEAYFYSPMDNLKNASIKSVSINGTDKNISQSAGSYNLYLWDNIESGSVPGYSAVVNSDAVKALGAITSGDVIKIVLSVTLDDSLKSIGAANFTCSKTAGELETGDSFTITYDSTNTPDTAKWVVKCAFDEDFADAGITNRWPQLVNADGTVDNSASADTGLEVAKTAEGVYTFTAVNASKAGYVINVEASAAGDFSDTQYLGQGGSGKWSVAAAAEPTYTIDPDTATIKVGESKVFTLEGYEGTEPLVWSIDTDFADMRLDSELTRHQVKIVGLAKSNGPLTLTIKKSENEILATATVTIVEDDTPPAAETVEIAFPTGVIELTVQENEWDGQEPHGLMAKADINASGESIGKTFAELNTSKLKLTGVKFDNCSVDGITAGDVKVTLFTQWTGWAWKPAAEVALNSESIEFDLSTITGVNDTDELLSYGFQITINDNSKLTGLAVDDIVKINDAGTKPPTPPVTGDKTFEGEATITCDNYWGQTTITLEQLIGDLDPAKTTVVFTGEFLNKIGFNSVSQTPAADGSKWREIEAANGKITLDASDLVTDGFYFSIAAGKESGDATISWVATEKGNEPDQPDQPDPPTPPVTTDAIWEGTQDFGNWADTPVEIEAEKFTSVNANDTIKFTYSINAVPGEAWNQIKIADGNDTVLASPTGKNEWGCVDLSSATTYSFEISAADLALVKANGMKITGHGVVLAKVEKASGSGNPPVDPGHTHTPGNEWKNDAANHWKLCSECGEKVNEAAHTFNTGVITTPATETTTGVKTYTCTVCKYTKTETIPATGVTPSPAPSFPSHNYTGGVVVPIINNGSNSKTPSINGDNGKSGWDAIVSEIAASGDGAKVVVDMNGATKVPSSIMREIEGLDIDLVLNMGRGTKWTINGLSVTGHKNIDFGVSKNTRHISGEVVSTVDGTYKKQLSLDHNGTFGCTAALTVDVGTKYNGLYANLFYYNPKTKSLELTDCSLISGGNAKFMFTHASDYLITVTAEPLGEFEDVSSAAGIASDNNSIGNGIAVSAVLAAIVLGFGIVVYRKRRHN